MSLSYLSNWQDGTTPLAYASRDGRTTIVKLLLEAGANVEAIDEV